MSTPLRLKQDDMQIVEIDDKYAYAWPGRTDLKIGDAVVLPGSSWLGSPAWSGRVTKIGTSYRGPVAQILRRVE